MSHSVVHSWEIARGCTPQCALGKLRWCTPQCPIRETKVSLIRGLRPMKTGRDKSVCKQPICPCGFSHCSLLTRILYHKLRGTVNYPAFDNCTHGLGEDVEGVAVVYDYVALFFCVKAPYQVVHATDAGGIDGDGF